MFDYILTGFGKSGRSVRLQYSVWVCLTSSIADLYRIDKSFKPDLRAEGALSASDV